MPAGWDLPVNVYLLISSKSEERKMEVFPISILTFCHTKGRSLKAYAPADGNTVARFFIPRPMSVKDMSFLFK